MSQISRALFPTGIASPVGGFSLLQSYGSPMRFVADFTTLPLGAYATAGSIQGLSFSRASAATVQTSASTVDSTPGTNVPRIGSLGLGWQGLVIDQAITQSLGQNETIPALASSTSANGWATQTGVTTTANAATAPDGTNTASLIDLTNAAVAAGVYATTVGSISASTMTQRDIWLRAVSGSVTVTLADPSQTQSTPSFTLGTTWQRCSLDQATIGGQSAAGIWVRKSSGNQVYAWLGSVLQNGCPTELPINSTSSTLNVAGDRLTHTNPSAIIDNGRLSVEIWLTPKGARGTYAAGSMLWYQDANNQCYLDSNGVLFVMVAGISTQCGSLAWTANEQLKIFVAAGNGITVAYYQDGSGTTYQIACPSTPLPPITPGTSIDLLQNGATHNFSAWVQRIAFWNSDSMPFEPNQLSGNVLWLRGDQGISYAMAPVTATGTTPPAVTLSGTPTQAPCNLEIDITTGGSLGTALFTWKLNGNSQQTGVATAASVSLPGTGLTANFPSGTYATNNVYTSSVTVSQWNNIATGGNSNFSQSTGSKQPTYDTSVINNQPALSFNGSSQYLSNFDASTTIASAATVICVFTLTAAINQTAFYSTRGALPVGGWDIYAGQASGTAFIYNDSGTPAGLNGGALTTNTPFIETLTMTNGSRAIYLNGALKLSDTVALPSGGVYLDNNSNVGFDSGATNYWSGYIAELIIYNRVLSASELEQVHQYLGTRYGITVS